MRLGDLAQLLSQLGVVLGRRPALKPL